MTQVQINELANLPHHDGQIVLRAARNDFEVEIKYDGRCDGGRYWVYAYVLRGGLPQYTRLAANRPTVRSARDLAARAWREGKDFDLIIG